MNKIKAQLFEHLIELERSLMREDVRADAARLNALIDDDFIEVSSDGRRFTKVNVLERLPKEQSKSRKPLFHNQEFVGRMLSDTVVQLYYRSALRRIKGGQWHFSVRMSLWRQDDQQNWQVVYHQSTPCEAFALEQP
ncbi:nuclear transport factor 2 family protein [Pseudoalteromonas sp. T1lg48]|uniref:nuclear transport factor 2 family protein n=1 Tax=Pseudoalteromonas sp. T1lg48 TaxID=2077100 RepID=UPI000CF6CEC8|nr:nuclear transport factor 2 family protein [Pseudoalteromonas sp. T1lg48]